MIKITQNWYEKLKDELESDYFKHLQAFLTQEYQTKQIFPNMQEIFTALNLVKFDDVKVVIFGQDPYHGAGQAHGLAFSVKEGVALPPSLKNIFKEIEAQTGQPCFKSGDLTRWAKQGVLLLNTTLTVQEGLPNSHQGKGWEKVTKKLVYLLNQRQQQVIFVLWGKNASEFENIIDTAKHIILKSAHPSPLSAHRGFFGNGHFKEINKILSSSGKSVIDWR